MSPDPLQPPAFRTHTDRARAVAAAKALDQRAADREQDRIKAHAAREAREAKAREENQDRILAMVPAVPRAETRTPRFFADPGEIAYAEKMVQKLNEVCREYDYHLFFSGTTKRLETPASFLLRCKKITRRADGLLATHELVARWGLKENQHVLNFSRRGHLPAFKEGNEYWYRPEEVERFENDAMGKHEGELLSLAEFGRKVKAAKEKGMDYQSRDTPAWRFSHLRSAFDKPPFRNE